MSTISHVIAISNRKGGTGKTTVSVNLSIELARCGCRVLLVDMDSQGHCAAGFGIEVQKGEPTAHDIFVDPAATLANTVRDTAFPNLAIAPADQLFEHGSGLRDDWRLARALAEPAIAGQFDVVVVDTPPSLDNLLLNALTAAGWVLIPYIPHQLSLDGIKQLMRTLFKVMSSSNPELKILGFLPMAAAEHIRQHRIITGEVSRQFGSLRVLPGIRSDIRIAESFGVGKPVRHYAPKSRGAQDFSQLAAHLIPLLGLDKPQR